MRSFRQLIQDIFKVLSLDFPWESRPVDQNIERDIYDLILEHSE